MKCSIKYTCHRSIRHQLLTCTHTDQVCGVMKRGQITTLFYSLDHFLCNQCRACKLLTTMYQTMSDCTDLIQALDHTGLLISQRIDHILDRLLMRGHVQIADLLFSTCRCIHESAIDTDSLAQTFCQYLLGIRVNHLIFQ